MKSKDKKAHTVKVIKHLRKTNIDYIQCYDNGISEELCDYLIDKHKYLDKKGITVDGMHYNVSGTKSKVDKNVKKSKDIFLITKKLNEVYKGSGDCYNVSEDDVFASKYNELMSAINKHVYLYLLYVGYISSAYTGINKDNFNLFFKKESDCPDVGLPVGVDSICLRKYERNGGAYHMPHFDAKGYHFRIVAVLIYLNDVKLGGETEFPVLNRVISPQKGRIAIFPSSFTHMHYGKISNSDKYIVASHVGLYPELKTKEKKEKE